MTAFTGIPPLDFSHSPDSFQPTCASSSLSSPEGRSSTPCPSPQLCARNDSIETCQLAVFQQDLNGTGSPLPADKKRNKLVKHRNDPNNGTNDKEMQLVKPRRFGHCEITNTSDDTGSMYFGSKSFRCDILAVSGADFVKAEAECKQLILESGGKLIDEFVYPGGFLYQVPLGINNPLQCGDETVGGGHIQIADWGQFPRPRFNGLRLAPYGGAGEYLMLPVPPHRSKSLAGAANMRTAWRRSALGWEDKTKRRASLISWLSGWTRDYGGGMSYVS